MMRIREVKKVPKRVLRDLECNSSNEFSEAGASAERVFEASERKWIIYRDGRAILIAGVVRKSMIGNPPELWILLCREFRRNLFSNAKEARALVGTLLEMYPKVWVKVPVGFTSGHKFVKLFGFHWLKPLSLGGKDFIIYEASDVV